MYAIALKNLQSARKALWALTIGPDLAARRGGDPRSRQEGLVMDATVSFGARNFAGVSLGDSRRSDRLVKAADTMCRHPGGTLPDKFPVPADLRAFYRLMDCERVTHGVLLEAHAAETRRRLAACVGDVALIVHDATELDYTSKKSLEEQLGQIGQGTHRGYICHNSLVVRLTRNEQNDEIVPETLGLAAQILHHRPRVAKKETAKAKRERLSRESRLWLNGVKACGRAPKGVLCVDVSDSLSDTFEYMAHEVTAHRHFLLRAREDRKLQEPIGGERYLFSAVRALAPVGERDITIAASPGRKARKTKVRVAFTPVVLAVPGKALGEYEKKPLPLWAVRVWEPTTPKDEEPLEWILLTNCEVSECKQAFERIDWYQLRWIIEEYHKGMKTGCGIETLQFERIERLEPAIALISAVATQLLRLRDAARAPDASVRLASEVVDRAYIQGLVCCYPSRMKANPTVLEFYMHVARLGGHQNRKGDGFPGWLTLWRGWTKLESVVTGLVGSRVTCGKT
jgi:hypothetical protein